jgi:hypothetical protein
MYLDKKDFVRNLHVREERVRNLAIFERNINFHHNDATKKSKIINKMFTLAIWKSNGGRELALWAVLVL